MINLVEYCLIPASKDDVMQLFGEQTVQTATCYCKKHKHVEDTDYSLHTAGCHGGTKLMGCRMKINKILSQTAAFHEELTSKKTIICHKDVCKKNIYLKKKSMRVRYKHYFLVLM